MPNVRRNRGTLRHTAVIVLIAISSHIAAGEAVWNEKEEDAKLPASVKLYWGEEPVETLSTKRGQICLNGIWQFVPMLDRAETQPPSGLAYISVPGSWKPCGPLPGLVSGRGKGPAWRNWGAGSGIWCAWYQRKIRIPAPWANQAILVSLERVSTDAIIYANGTKCGAIGWPYGEVDISQALKAGAEAVLQIQVLATSDNTPATSFLDPGRVVTTAANLESKGLIGDVFLRSRPQGAHISDAFVQTSTRKKELKLDVEVSDVTVAGPVQFTARLLDANGREEQCFQSQAAMDGSKKQLIQLAWTWDNPRLWDFQQPNLYTLKLEAKGANWSDEYAQPFGFREFWIEGRKFLLNGTEIRFRPNAHGYTESCFGGSVELTDAHIEGCMYAGFNMEECWPVNHDQKGSVNYRELWAERADRKGFLLMGTALPIDPGQWQKAEYQESHGRKLERELRRYRNHPSIVIWTTNPNWLGNGLDQDPRYIGRSESAALAPTLENWKKAAAKGAVAAIKKLDPTRPVLNHAGAYNGDIYNINCYLNLIPLQEREEWLTEWAKTGDMPLMCCEFGTPWKYTFLQGRWGFEASTEPLATEYCAIYLGAEAYALETTDYRQAIRRQYKGGRQFGDMGANWNTVMDALPAFQRLQALFNRNTFRSWRTLGITGGMVPWDYGYGWDAFDNERRRKGLQVGEQDLRPFTPGMRGTARAKATVNLTKPFQPGGMDIYPEGVALMAANGPTLAWIAGGPSAFTAKDHNFEPAQDVEKQVVLINDQRTPQDYQYAWTAELDGKQFAGDNGKGRIEPAQTVFVPLRCRVPGVAGNTKTTGTIALTAKIGDREHKDAFSFRVFPKANPLPQSVALYDPVGKTAKMLAALGCKAQEWNGKPVSELVVIGREALSGGKALPFVLEALVGAGGRVLVCAQSPEWLCTTLGFRVAPHLSRRVFPVSAAHPVCQGLDATDLSDWCGESTLVEAHPRYPIPSQVPGWRSPDHGWHWGNLGAVTSAALEKPHRGGWRPILECEFDLAYSPLMELDYGQGRLILCTLDLEDHVSLDPAAALLARNLLQYAAATTPLARAKRTILVGDDTDKKTLEALGVAYQPAAKLEPDADLVVVGCQAQCNEADLQKHLAKGGKVLFLALSAPEHECGVKLRQVQACAGSLNIPAWPECQGLSPSDLHWRTESPAWLVESGVEKGADGLLGLLRKGNGVAVFCQIDPERFQAEQKPYFRLTRWRQTRALAQILANLGASFAKDREAFRLTPEQGKKETSGWYGADYRDEFKNGDDPYRYFRW
ncbi:MAG: glycoside hydrolase family 2 TIM barrel-domain containing protein [Planctomycetota bacterium]